jgi:enamine deaminase RidA (YjgF/YER057c/UK114 family)
LGDWSGLKGIVRLSGYVASGENFTSQAQVMDGASNLFAQVLGERGVHARLAMGVSELPLGVPVELEVIAEVSA